jgi:hypothetical protein
LNGDVKQNFLSEYVKAAVECLKKETLEECYKAMGYLQNAALLEPEIEVIQDLIAYTRSMVILHWRNDSDQDPIEHMDFKPYVPDIEALEKDPFYVPYEYFDWLKDFKDMSYADDKHSGEYGLPCGDDDLY